MKCAMDPAFSHSGLDILPLHFLPFFGQYCNVCIVSVDAIVVQGQLVKYKLTIAHEVLESDAHQLHHMGYLKALSVNSLNAAERGIISFSEASTTM